MCRGVSSRRDIENSMPLCCGDSRPWFVIFCGLQNLQWLEAGSYLRLIDSCITQLKAQGPFRTCNEGKEEEEGLQCP